MDRRNFLQLGLSAVLLPRMESLSFASIAEKQGPKSFPLDDLMDQELIEVPIERPNGLNLYEQIIMNQGSVPEFPLDFNARTVKAKITLMKNHGYIPERSEQTDYVYVPTYQVGSAVDWKHSLNQKHGKKHMLKWGQSLIENAIDNKMWSDELLTLAAEASQYNYKGWELPQFKKLLMGNECSVPPFNIAFGANGVKQTREIIPIKELNNDGMLRQFLIKDLGLSRLKGKKNIGILFGKEHSRVLPIRDTLVTFDDPTLESKGRTGMYGWMEYGVCSLGGNATVCYW